MTRLEERVREALIAEADRRAVDVDALWDATRVRLRPRRRGRMVALVAAAVLAILIGGGAVVWLHDGGSQQRPIERPTQAPTPPQISPSPPEVSRPRTAELRDDASHLASVAFAGTSFAIAEWQVCGDIASFGPCQTDLTRTNDGWSSLDVTRPQVRYGVPLSVLSDGSIAVGRGHALEIVDADGRTHDAAIATQPSPAGLADPIFSSLASTGIWAYDRQQGLVAPVPLPPHIDRTSYAAKAPDGRLWVLGGSGRSAWVAWSDDGGASWVEHLVMRRGYPVALAMGLDGQVAVITWNDQGDTDRVGSIITHDNGTSWQPFDPSAGPHWTFTGPDSIASLPDGTIFAVDEKDLSLWTSTGDWQDWTRVPQAGRVISIESNGELLWAKAGKERMVVSHDGGQTWQTVIPG